jgi:phosphatidylinositol alpha 1,6-mannosyltransferase
VSAGDTASTSAPSDLHDAPACRAKLPPTLARDEVALRIAYFTESLYPHVDGVSRTLARLFASLESSDQEFLIFSPFTPGAEVSWSDRVRPVRYVRFPLYIDYRISLPVVSRSVGREMKAFRPDLVHVVSPTPMAVWAQRWAARHGVPVVSSFHTHFVSYFRYYGVPWLEPGGWLALRRFYARCARVYAPSWSIIRELESHGLERLELWSRGIDLAGFTPTFRDQRLRREAGADETTPLVLLVSRLVKEKDLADLVEMERLLRERGVRFSLVLVGDGPMRRELENSLPGAIFAGHQSGEQLARWYASADVFVFPSTTETLGNVVLEALASGVPAVVTDRGGPQDLIRTGENGFVVRGNAPEEMADRVESMLRDRGLRGRLAAAARQSALSRDWETINGALIESYRDVVRRSRGPGSRTLGGESRR